MSGSGKGGDNRGSRRRPFRRRERDNNWQDSPKGESKKTAETPQILEGKIEKRRGGLYERPRWIAPKLPTEPLPSANCAWCGEPIKDISTALSESGSGRPVHFECVLAKISENETLEPGDAISYIGGGRFGIIHFNNPANTKDFNIKRIFEWENKENNADWRRSISEHFSVT
ncbi:MAG: hypothetical protein LBH97_05505 [Treponema sp.]|jgi:hypothetical protein|nr:hypothetical protein [Treponema sp.]